jgi:hypothetical protein
MTRALAIVTGTRAAVLTLLAWGTAKTAGGQFKNATCEGTYSEHLQGICTGDKDSIFWCFTDVVARGKYLPGTGHTATVLVARIDPKRGLVIRQSGLTPPRPFK